MKITEAQLKKIIAEEYSIVKEKTHKRSNTRSSTKKSISKLQEKRRRDLLEEYRNKAETEYLMEIGGLSWLKGTLKGLAGEMGEKIAAPYKKAVEFGGKMSDMAKSAGTAALDSVTAIGDAIGGSIAKSAKSIADAATQEMTKEYQALGEKIRGRVADAFKADGKDPDEADKEEFDGLLASILNLANAQAQVAMAEGAQAGKEYKQQLDERLKRNQRVLRERRRRRRK